MLSQKVTQRPGWNHEIAIGWRSKNFEVQENYKMVKYTYRVHLVKI